MKKILVLLLLPSILTVGNGCSDPDGNRAESAGDSDSDSDGDSDSDSDEPYFTAGDWHGHGWSNAGTVSGGTVTQISSDYTLGDDDLCVSGILVEDYSSLGLIGMNVNQPDGGTAETWYSNGTYTGVYVNITENLNTIIRIELNGSNGETYCAEIDSGATSLQWNDFSTECWGTGGNPYNAGTGIDTVQLYAAGDQNAVVEFDYCVHDLYPIGGGDGDSDADSDSDADLPKFVGNITTGYDAALDYDGMNYADHWDQVTPENAGKWGSVESYVGATRNWQALDAVYGYTEDHNIIFKQHAFVWGNQQPDNADTIQEANVKSWMNEFCDRYPNTRLIDVVNEPPPHTEPAYTGNIGGGTNGSWQWIINSFLWADDACPDAVLLLNDYNNIEWGDQNQHFIDIVNTIQNAGAPIDAVGAQAHDLDHEALTTDSMKGLVAKLHNDTGLPVYITEYDISFTDDSAQLAKYQEQFPFFMETDYIHGITIWGWIYGQTWNQAPYSGLVNNGNPRSAMTWLMNTLGRPVP